MLCSLYTVSFFYFTLLLISHLLIQKISFDLLKVKTGKLRMDRELSWGESESRSSTFRNPICCRSIRSCITDVPPSQTRSASQILQGVHFFFCCAEGEMFSLLWMFLNATVPHPPPSLRYVYLCFLSPMLTCPRQEGRQMAHSLAATLAPERQI